jgi:hypothetical protein
LIVFGRIKHLIPVKQVLVEKGQLAATLLSVSMFLIEMQPPSWFAGDWNGLCDNLER